MSTPLMMDSWYNLCQSAISDTLPQTNWWLNLFLGIKNKNKKTTNNHMMANVTSWKDPGYIEQLSLHMLRRELNYFATQELLGCSWGAHHVLDTCILLDTLKLLVEAAFWFWRCPTQESNQSERKLLEENISWQSLYTVWFKLDFELAWHQLLATDTRGC